jgi:hypothetical protein
MVPTTFETLGLRKSTSPMHLKGFKFMHLPLDPTVVGPSRPDLMDEICSSPAHSFLPVWTLIQWSRFFTVLDPMAIVSPPPELTLSSDLEEFLSVKGCGL